MPDGCRLSRVSNRSGLVLTFSTLGIFWLWACWVNEKKSASSPGLESARSRSIWRRARHRPARRFRGVRERAVPCGELPRSPGTLGYQVNDRLLGEAGQSDPAAPRDALRPLPYAMTISRRRVRGITWTG